MGNIKQASTQQLARKLLEKTEMDKKQIKQEVQRTRKKYHPLISSNKNALLLYAREEKGIQLLEKTPPELKIENIVPDMRDVSFEAKIHSVDKFEYRKDGEQKKGCSVKLFDDSGSIELMLWGEDVDRVSNSMENRVVRIENAYSNRYEGEVQINFNDSSTIEVIEE